MLFKFYRFFSYILDNTKKPFKQKTLYSNEKGENCIKQLHINIKIENVSFQFHPSYFTLRNKLKVYKHQSLETEGDNVILPEEMPLQPEDSCDTDFRPRYVYMYLLNLIISFQICVINL